jgi:hypothetical protein
MYTKYDDIEFEGDAVTSGQFPPLIYIKLFTFDFFKTFFRILLSGALVELTT